MIWPRRTARTSWFQFTPLGLSTHSPCVIRSAPRRNESGRVAPVPPIGPLVSLASGLRSPPETPNGWPPGRGRPRGWHPRGLLHSARALSAFIAKARSSLSLIWPTCPPETPFGWQIAAGGLPSGNAPLISPHSPPNAGFALSGPWALPAPGGHPFSLPHPSTPGGEGDDFPPPTT